MNPLQKVLFGSAGLATLLFVAGCSKSDSVEGFANDFADKLSKNQVRALAETYPDILEAESLYKPSAKDEITVNQLSNPDKYEVVFAPEVTMIVGKNKKGEFVVEESKGLFTYPEEKLQIARQTGLWDDTLNDAEMAKRMQNTAFFAYLEEKRADANSLLSLGAYHKTGYGEGYFTVTNNTDQEIKGNEYSVTVREYSTDYDLNRYGDVVEVSVPEKTYQKAGQTLPPHGTAKFYISMYLENDVKATGYKMNLSDAEISQRFGSYTGNEYNEYLKK